MTTTINSNGSRFAGDEPATLEDLFLVLETHPLTEYHRKNGIEEEWTDLDGNRRRTFSGNFEDISHVFSVETDDEKVIARFRDVFRRNRYTLPRASARCPCWDSHFARRAS